MKIPRVPDYIAKLLYVPRGTRHVGATVAAMVVVFIIAGAVAIQYHYTALRRNFVAGLATAPKPPPPDPDVLARREIATRVEGAEFEVMKVRRLSRSGIMNWYYEYIVTCRSAATARASGQPEDHVPPGRVLAGRIDFTAVGHYPNRDDFTQAALTAGDALHPGPGWIAWQHASLRMSLDGCATWIEFEPSKHLHPAQVHLPGDRPCDNQQCVHFALHNSGLAFGQVAASREAGAVRLSFVMTSRALASRAGVAVSSEDGGSTWRISEIAAVEPARVAMPEAPAAQAPPPAATRRLRALGDDELQAIPMPAVRGDRLLLIARIRDAARRGSVEGVKRAWIKDVFTKPGDDVELYREAVLAVMDRKTEPASSPPPPSAPSAYVMDDAELARIAPPRLQDPSSDWLVADIRAAAKAGDLSRVMALGISAGPANRDEIDRYVGRIADAMLAKAAQAKPASTRQ